MQQQHIDKAISELSGASQALSRAAHALQLANPGRPPAARNGGGRSPADRLTAKQLGAIRVACRRADVTAEKLAGLVAQVSEHATDIADLSRAEASALLDSLDALSGYGR